MNDSRLNCFVCCKHRGDIDLPGGVIFEDDLIFISHANLLGEETEHYLGHLIIETKRHVADLSDLNEDEARSIGLFICRTAKALKITESMEHVYAFFIGDKIPHVHIHVIGRYSGTPKEFWGPRVDEWPDAPRGGTEKIAQVAYRVREFFQQEHR